MVQVILDGVDESIRHPPFETRKGGLDPVQLSHLMGQELGVAADPRSRPWWGGWAGDVRRGRHGWAQGAAARASVGLAACVRGQGSHARRRRPRRAALPEVPTESGYGRHEYALGDRDPDEWWTEEKSVVHVPDAKRPKPRWEERLLRPPSTMRLPVGTRWPCGVRSARRERSGSGPQYAPARRTAPRRSSRHWWTMPANMTRNPSQR
jgi:hypothetical protein